MIRRDVFQAIADPTRRDILSLVVNESMTPNALAAHFECSRQAVSKHLQILMECELLQQDVYGREIYYSFNPAKMQEIERWLQPFRENWESRFSKLDKFLKNPKNKNP